MVDTTLQLLEKKLQLLEKKKVISHHLLSFENPLQKLNGPNESDF